MQIGVAKTRLGRTEETESHILEALRLSPRIFIKIGFDFDAR